jgi:hypothetical protein
MVGTTVTAAPGADQFTFIVEKPGAPAKALDTNPRPNNRPATIFCTLPLTLLRHSSDTPVDIAERA